MKSGKSPGPGPRIVPRSASPPAARLERPPPSERKYVISSSELEKLIYSKRNAAISSPVARHAGTLNLQFLRKALKRIAIWSIAASLVVHLILGALSAVVVGQRVIIVVTAPPEEPEPEVELRFPEPPKPPEEKPKQEAQYVRTSQNPREEQRPAKPDFESDRNTVAMSKDAPDPSGDPLLPSMKGKEGPGLDLSESNYRDGQLNKDSPPAPPQMAQTPPPSAPPQQSPPPPEPARPEIVKKEESALDRMMREAESLAAPVLEPSKSTSQLPTTTPNSSASHPPQQAATAATQMPPALQDAYMPYSRTRQVKGGVTQRGDQNAINAAKTIAGDYYRQAQDTIGQRWNKEVAIKNVKLLPGRVVLRVLVDRNGYVTPEDVTVALDNGGPVLKETAFNAVANTKLPPLPPDMAPVLESDKFEMLINFIFE